MNVRQSDQRGGHGGALCDFVAGIEDETRRLSRTGFVPIAVFVCTGSTRPPRHLSRTNQWRPC